MNMNVFYAAHQPTAYKPTASPPVQPCRRPG